MSDMNFYEATQHVYPLNDVAEQEHEARSLLIDFCRLRINVARDKAKAIYARADAGEAILNAII